MSKQKKMHWRVVAADPPKLSQSQWNIAAVAGIVLLAAAVLQLIGFQDFIDNLAAAGVSNSKWWAGGILFSEIIAAASFFRLRLSPAFRLFSGGLALLASFFWFFETLKLVNTYADVNYKDVGLSHPWVADFFGKYLPQQPGWWVVIEAAVFCSLVMYVLSLQKWPGKPGR